MNIYQLVQKFISGYTDVPADDLTNFPFLDYFP
jgi:hypothetical protein